MKNYFSILGMFLFVMSVKDSSAQDASLKITDNVNRATKHEVATESISATNVVSEDSKVHYEAGKMVKLLPGFTAKNGANFKASIGKIASSSRIAGDERMDKVSMYAYPNPFETVVEIQYYLPKSGKVTLSVTNIIGMTIATLVDNQEVSEGNHTVKYSGDGTTSGTYLYTLKTDTGAISKKLSKK